MDIKYYKYLSGKVPWCAYAIVGPAKHFKIMAGFNFVTTNGDGRFRIGRQSIFRDGLTFTVSSVTVGVYQDDSGKVLNNNNGNSIRFVTSISDKPEDAININRFLNKRRVVYDKDGHASILYDCAFHDELLNFLETKIGRDSEDPTSLNGTAKAVADRVFNEFFKDKTIVCKKLTDIYFKTIKDGVEKLEPPYDDVIVFEWKS